MTNLDLETLRFFSRIIVTISVIAILAFWRSSNLKKGVGYWVLGIVVYALFPYLSIFPENTFGINTNFLIDLCIIGSSILLLHGTRKVFNQPTLLIFKLGVGIAAAGISAYITISNADPLFRIINTSLTTAIVSAVIAFSLITQQKFTLENSLLSSASVFIAYAFYQGLVSFYIISAVSPDPSLLINIFHCSSLFTLGITMTLIHISYKILQTVANEEKTISSTQIKNIESRWLLALEFSKAGHWEWDLKTQETHYSSQWKKMLGYTDEDQLGNSLASLKERFHPDDTEHIRSNMTNFLNGSTDIYESIHRIISKNGEWVWILSRARFLKVENGEKPSSIIGIDIDITAQKKAEEALQQAITESEVAKDTANLANKAKTTFLSNMSHEIRTPMNAILGFSQLLKDDSNINAEQRESLNVINSSGEHLLSLIDSILDWSRIESGNVELLKDKFNPVELFQEISSSFSVHEKRKKFEFLLELDPKLPAGVISDSMKIRQICTNLLDNAFKFTEQGKVTLKVSVSDLKKETSVLIIQVIDTGIGIKAEEEDTIFSIFGQTESGIKATQGTGLGLFISKNLASLLSGSLEFTSQKNQGTCFTLTIPVVVNNEDINDTTEIKAPPQIKHLEKRGTRLLIVDDIESNRQLLQRMLNGLGFVIWETNTAIGVVQLIEQFKPDIVLMDIRMPEVSGDKAIDDIRRQDNNKDLMIIAITANVSEGEKGRLLKIGANDVVSKPFSRQEILNKISFLLNINYVFKQDTQADEISEQVQCRVDSTHTAAHLNEADNINKADNPNGPEGKKILVVDDNEANCLLLHNQLNALGFSAETACNGEEGLQLWKSQHFALILTDCAMPIMNGFEMTEAIRNEEDPSVRKAIIIAITGSVEENRGRGIQSGMNGLLGKPLLLNTLKLTLEKYLG